MKLVTSKATVHGAISIVNAISTGKGSALGVSLKTIAEISLLKGEGKIIYNNHNTELFDYLIKKILPKKMLATHNICLSIYSEIPIGFGLKSSSAVSSAVSLACYGLLDRTDDLTILNTAVRASRKAKITVTGAYDDSAACYFGGFVVTDNYSNTLIRRDKAPNNIYAIILLPRNSRRKDILKLKLLPKLFNKAIEFAEKSDYWQAMNLNGLLVSSLMSYDYTPVLSSIEQGALSASISGNGPSVAVVSKEKNVQDILSVLKKYGKTLVCKINNNKASVDNIVG